MEDFRAYAKRFKSYVCDRLVSGEFCAPALPWEFTTIFCYAATDEVFWIALEECCFLGPLDIKHLQRVAASLGVSDIDHRIECYNHKTKTTLMSLRDLAKRGELQEFVGDDPQQFFWPYKAHNSRYDRYLKSDKWKSKRRKVLTRANGKCEGCLEARATEVHHVDYQHLFDEPLFELRALCSECHRAISEQDKAKKGRED